MCDGDNTVLVGSICCLAVIITAFCVGFSFGSVDTNELALDVNMNTQTLNLESLYENGVHFIGLGHSLVKFPKTVIDMDMQNDPVVARTVDGLIVSMNTRITYKLSTSITALATLYLNFGEEWEAPIYYLARSVITDVASEYTAFEFWKNREEVSEEIRARLLPRMEDFYCTIDSFSLANFDLPSDFQTAITQTDVQQQLKDQIDFQKTTAVTLKNTKVSAAAALVTAVASKAEADGQSELLKYDAQVENLAINAKAEGTAYANLVTELGLDADQLATLVWIDSLATDEGTTKKKWSLKTPASLNL
jgi:regulator of protease activity HflC (stomatin/prohibitin superfamily)